jgi:hypothetical protein
VWICDATESDLNGSQSKGGCVVLLRNLARRQVLPRFIGPAATVGIVAVTASNLAAGKKKERKETKQIMKPDK